MTRDQLTVLGIAAVCVALVGVVGQLVIRSLRGRGLATVLVAVSWVSLLAVALAVGVDARVMFLSTHDSVVVGLALATATPLAVGLSIWLARQVRRSADVLAQAARAIAGGTDVAGGPAEPDGPPQKAATNLVSRELTAAHRELLAAGRAVRESREHEQALESSRRELVAWISHDLRTPLAGIRAMAEALEDGVAEDPALYHKRLRVESDRLAQMVDTLFLLSRLHAGALRPAREEVDLHDLISDAVASIAPIAEARRVQVLGAAPPGIVVPVDPAQLSRALANLLANGVRHTPSDGCVVVGAERLGDRVRLAVQDACGGIPEAELPRVFDLAWRGQSARSRGPDGGGGLGLTVAQGIATAHGGTVSVVNTGPGCRFDIELPIKA
jgi:signal transduction histidine kinase